MDNQKKYICKDCGREYKHRQNLHRHTKSKHTINHCTSNISNVYQKYTHLVSDNDYKNDYKIDYNCKYCDKVFSFSSGKYRHEKKCKQYKVAEDVITKEEHKAELQKLETEITEKLTKQFTIMLNEKHGYTTNNTLKIGDNQTDIGTQNNITIVQLGKEDVLGTLTQKEKLKILNERYRSVLSLVKLMHCSGKYPQFNNAIISNLKSEFALTYSDEDDKFMTTTKNNLVSDIVSHRTANVEELLDENKEKLTKQTNKKVKELIKILEKDGITLLEDETDFIKNYKTKIMTNIYDNRDELKKKIKEIK
jgi:phage FluMu protein Com